jgi:hypothetical protein
MQKFDQPLFDTKLTAEYLNMSVEWLKKNRGTGGKANELPPPKYVKVGGRIKYRKSDLDQYITDLPSFAHISDARSTKGH